MQNYCFLNGRIIPEGQAKVSVNDIGLLRGYGVFDFLRSYDGKPFILDRHLDRFEHSAKLLDLKIPVSREKIKEIITNLLEKNNLKDAGIRLVLTGGPSKDGVSFGEEFPTFYILTKELPKYSASYYQEGVKLITHEYQREIPEAKTINYITMLSLTALKKKLGALEILYTSKGSILEGASCNFFVFKGDVLITADLQMLRGTRRRIILDLCKGKFKVEERTLKVEELQDVTEAFITSTTRDIMPVTRIDDFQIGDGSVGPNTKILMILFNDFIAANI